MKNLYFKLIPGHDHSASHHIYSLFITSGMIASQNYVQINHNIILQDLVNHGLTGYCKYFGVVCIVFRLHINRIWCVLCRLCSMYSGVLCLHVVWNVYLCSYLRCLCTQFVMLVCYMRCTCVILLFCLVKWCNKWWNMNIWFICMHKKHREPSAARLWTWIFWRTWSSGNSLRPFISSRARVVDQPINKRQGWVITTSPSAGDLDENQRSLPRHIAASCQGLRHSL